jgi:phosphatidylethanolamine/phosphatidyl-N-methylethanolamine N-methyltransferase
MDINTNAWNKIRYTLFAPGYDHIARYFRDSRQKSIESLGIKAGDRVLIVGAGTGLDLEFLPAGCHVVATDITPAMVERARKRSVVLNRHVDALVMDGQALAFGDNEFDAVVLHLILAVIPNPVACLKEAGRVVKPNGKVAVFDKFVRKNQLPSMLRRFVNLFSNFFFTDITRCFEPIVGETALTVLSDVDANFNGHFRLILLGKP